MSSKSILIIASYTVSNLVRFFCDLCCVGRYPLDVVAHKAEGCLYVADWAEGGERGGRVWRVSLSGSVSQFLDDIDKPRKLSLVGDRLLIVGGGRLVVCRLPEGKTLSEVVLPVADPQHAVELLDGEGRLAYLVGHGESSDVPHRVSRLEVSSTGTVRVVQSYGGEGRGSGPGELSWPAHVSLAAGDGRVIVADCDNHRVLVLDSRLRLERVVLTKDDHDIETPRRLCYVDHAGLLLVGINFGCVDVYRIK